MSDTHSMTTLLKIFEKAGPALLAAALALFWELAIPRLGVPGYVIPTISQIAQSLATHADLFLLNSYITLVESIVGCVFGCIFGLIIGVAMSEIRMVGRLLLPYVISSNAIPVVAIAPLVVLWFGQGLISRSIVAAFLSFFPITINVYLGLGSFKLIYREMFILFGATRWEFFWKFKIVNALPFVFSGLKVSGTLAVIGAVVAEFIAPESGIGFGMLQATYNLDTPRLFGYLLISCAMGMAMYGAGRAVELLWLRRIGQLNNTLA